ncbi:cell wall-binding repeat-containing protein [Microbacterium sp.]|uniref:cell wall-binding repeat-containing protein n=1 Tax=Microbacterium sp. TaxID=51671 RepID=UPI00281102F8|nr:cell wall-binding repeat-containing protein [Microbacterium sp.]
MTSSRVSGGDRYGTSAAISRAAFPDPTSVSRVFLVAGASFADGLAAGPAAAATGGAVLMTHRAALTPTAATEIRRIAPKEIVIVGGVGVVSSEVERQARALAPTVTRVSGDDRYETSRRIVERFFPGAEPTVYLATGRDFPDALSGGALAARTGAPVLLVDGVKQSVDNSTRQALERLSADKVVAFGGTGVVSSKLLASASAATSASAARLGGSNRYETSTRIEAAVAGNGEVLMVTGLDFPDALSAIQLAAVRNAPIVLTVPYCIGGSTIPAVSSATRLTLIGGPGAVRGLVGSRPTCLPTRTATSPWVMVNKKTALRPPSYVPADLRTVGGTSERMRAEAATALERMIAAAKNEGAGRIKPGSGYRSYTTQTYLYNNAVASKGKTRAELGTARPGHSEHQTGWTMDVVACTSSYCSGIDDFGGSPQGRWTVKNAHRFGFIVRYEPGYTSITGYASEPWHLRYVGVPLATDYKKGGFHTLEEYLVYPAAPAY